MALNAEPIVLPDRANKLVGRSISFYLDSDDALTADAALRLYRKGAFQQSATQTVALGFTSATAWIAFAVDNQSASDDWYMSIKYPVHDRIRFYDVTEGGPRLRRETGDTFPFRAREVLIRDFAFALQVPPGETRTFLISARSWNSIVFPVYVRSLAETLEDAERDTFIYGLFLGLLGVIGIYNLFLYAIVKDRSYLYYVLYVFVFWWFQAAFLGVSLQYLFPNHAVWIDKTNPIFATLSFFFGTLFAYEFLGVRNLGRGLNRTVLALLALTALLVPTVIFVGNRWINFLGILLPPILIFAAAAAYRRGFRPARYFLLAWSGFVIMILLWTAASRGWIANTWIHRYGLLVGSTLEVVLLSVALGDRINVLKRERETALKDQLETKARLLQSFSRFVPLQFIRSLGADSVEEVTLGRGVRRDVTVMFCDIRNFTAMSEQMSVDQNFRFINGYLRRIGPVISEHGGFIDKFIGDAIMAIFPDSVDDALLAALRMHTELSDYNRARALKGYVAIEIGIGLHRGPVILGTVGTHTRMDTTVIGDAVNVAARIEEETKERRRPILVSGDCVAVLTKPAVFPLTEIGASPVRGKAAPIVLYELSVEPSGA